MFHSKKIAHTDSNGLQDFKHDQVRWKNKPPAGIASIYEARERQIQPCAYEPQLQWAGKVQIIYIEPTYDTKYSSNCQLFVIKLDIKVGNVPFFIMKVH